jgi:hypothetical protein
MGIPSEVLQFRADLLSSGYKTKAYVEEAKLARLTSALRANPDSISTPPEELRYMEGIIGLPLNHFEFFCVIPKDGDGHCSCGRRMSVLDITMHAIRAGIHSREMMRDALSGAQNIFEIAQDGRKGECLSCGRPVETASYFGKSYIYA